MGSFCGKQREKKDVHTSSVIAIVVTYNRKAMLFECLQVLMNQSVSCDILVVDNASTDGTEEYLLKNRIFENDRIHYLRLDKNVGGSGGFHQGVNYCMSGNWNWFWFMDDDAKPEEMALEYLLKYTVNQNHIYGSVAVGMENGIKRLCFPAKTLKGSKRGFKFIEYHELLDEEEEVAWLPFLGLLINRNMVKNIGLPDPNFFILNDDVEYCERAKMHGAKIIIIKKSIIFHPLPDATHHCLLGKNIIYRSMPPWKIYYNVRNKIIVAKRYHGFQLWSQIIPGILFRAFCSLLYEKRVLSSLYAHAVGTIDGLFNNTYKRFLPPGNSSHQIHKEDASLSV